ncbi:probable E3 ubiquitin-protein ligase XBOS32 [Tanacetum coccineum]
MEPVVKLKPIDAQLDLSQGTPSSLYETINRPADGGVTALHMAALNGHVLQLLIDLRASVNEVTMEDGTTIDLIGAGRTPLHMLHAVEMHNVVMYAFWS